MKPILCLSLTVALLFGSFVGSRASVLVDFETSEGFVANSRINSAGWSFSSNTRIRISDGVSEPAHSGNLSVYTLGGATISATNVSLATPSEALNTFTISTISPITSWVNSANTAWVYVFLWDDTAKTNRAVQFLTRYGTTAGSPYRVGYTQDKGDGSGSVITAFANVAIDFTEWNTFSLVFDFTNQRYTLNLNGSAVATDIALPDSWNVTAVIGTWLVSPGDASTTTYYDSLSITSSIPEPPALALGGAAGLALLAIKTRRSRRR